MGVVNSILYGEAVDLTDHLNVDPVLLCNDLGQIRDLTRDIRAHAVIQSSGRTSMSIKESARVAQSNNLMGLICRSSLLVRPASISAPVPFYF